MFRHFMFFLFPILVFACKENLQSSKVEVREGKKLENTTSFNGAAYFSDGIRFCNFSLYQENGRFFAATTAHCMVNYALPSDGVLRLFGKNPATPYGLALNSLPVKKNDLLVFEVQESRDLTFNRVRSGVEGLTYLDIVSYGSDRQLIRRRIDGGFLVSQVGLECNHDFQTSAGQSGAGLYGNCANDVNAEGCQLICIHRGDDSSGDEPIGLGTLPPTGQ